MAVIQSQYKAQFVKSSDGTSLSGQKITLQTGSMLEIRLMILKQPAGTMGFPMGVSVTPDGNPASTGQVKLVTGGSGMNYRNFKLTGFRPGPLRIRAVEAMNLLDQVDIQVVGAELASMTVLDALESLRLKMSPGDAKVLKDSVNGDSKSVFVDDAIVELLAALLRKGSVDVLSMMRKGESQHGVVVGSKVFVKAIDINGFQAKAVNSNGGQALVDLVCEMLKLFPAYDYDLGFPRPVGGATGFDPKHDVFFSVPDQATAQQCWDGTISRSLQQMLQPAQDKVNAAMATSAATFHVLYPDGLNHLHVNVTRFMESVTKVTQPQPGSTGP